MNMEPWIIQLLANHMGISCDQVTPNLIAYISGQRFIDLYTYLAYLQALNRIKNWVI